MDKHVIGTNAGILWQLLSTDSQRKWSFAEIQESTNLNDVELASAIGWLARENKIQLELPKHNGEEHPGLIYLMLNFYF